MCMLQLPYSVVLALVYWQSRKCSTSNSVFSTLLTRSGIGFSHLCVCVCVCERVCVCTSTFVGKEDEST